MAFSYDEKDAYRVIWRDLRQVYVKYMFVAKESSQLFSFQLFPVSTLRPVLV